VADVFFGPDLALPLGFPMVNQFLVFVEGVGAPLNDRYYRDAGRGD
jgi:hypothetical protein